MSGDAGRQDAGLLNPWTKKPTSCLRGIGFLIAARFLATKAAPTRMVPERFSPANISPNRLEIPVEQRIVLLDHAARGGLFEEGESGEGTQRADATMVVVKG